MPEVPKVTTSGDGPLDSWIVGAPVHFVVTGEPIGPTSAVQLLGDGETRDATLVVRRGDLPPVGKELDGWILDASRVPQVTIDDFGFLPISDGMRPRYQRAVTVGLALVRGVALTAEAAEPLSELKGMFNRVARHDQRDWASVSAALGHPGRAVAARWAREIGAVREAVVMRTSPVTAPLDRELDLQSSLRNAEKVLSGRGLGMVRRMPPGGNQANSLVNRHQVTRAEPDGPQVRPRMAALIRREETYTKLERANRVHEETRSALADELIARGFEPAEDQLLDLFCELPAGLAIYEVKSVTASNWRSQIRKGTAQLKEYRFLYGKTDSAALYLVLSEPPPEPWVLELLVAEYQIGVLWGGTDGFVGPGARAALGGSPS